MKKITKLALSLVCLGVATPSQAHKEWVHQYMVKEAYTFLENQIGTIPVLRHAVGLGYVGMGDSQYPFNTSYPISVGAWREDNEDVVYGYASKDYDPHGYASQGFVQDATPSITHFWMADRGDNDRMNYGPTPIENAWQKAQVLLFSAHAPGNHKRLLIKWRDNYNRTAYYSISYNSLPELYKGNFVIHYIRDTEGNYQGYGMDQQISNPEYKGGFPRTVALQLLGRVAHLLGDMGVPAHAHNHAHPCPVGLPDKFENHLGNVFYTNNTSVLHGSGQCELFPGSSGLPAYRWNATTAMNQGTILSGIYCLGNDIDKIKYLFYTQNQLADYFPSGVNVSELSDIPYNGIQGREYGNNLLNYGTNADIDAIYNQLGNNPPAWINTDAIGDVTFNFGIRATATLFQWFAYNAGIIDNLANTKILDQRPNGGICAGGAPSYFYIPGVDANNVAWSIFPSYAATGQVRIFHNAMGKAYSAYVLTPTADTFPEVLTLTASYNLQNGCYPRSNSLKRELWKGQPSGYIAPNDPSINLKVNPGANILLDANVIRKDLQKNLNVVWSSTSNSSVIGYNDQATVIAPSTWGEFFTVRATVSTDCGSFTSERLFQTVDNNSDCAGCGVFQRDYSKSNSSAIDHINNKLIFDAYPNPSDNIINLNIHNLPKDNPVFHIKIADVFGRIIVNKTNTGNIANINSEHIKSGIYILEVEYNNIITRKKIEIRH